MANNKSGSKGGPRKGVKKDMLPVERSESESDGDSVESGAGGKRQKLEKNSDEYKKRRERNNVAVRKSREASRQKAKDTMEKVSRLREENKALEQKVPILNNSALTKI